MKNLDVLNLYYKFAPVLVSKNNPDNTIINKIITTEMKKKIYTSPALSVEEFKMSEIVCASMKIGGGEFQEKVQPGDGTGNSTPRAKGREGIWDD